LVVDLKKRIWIFCLQEIKNEGPKLRQINNDRPSLFKKNIVSILILFLFFFFRSFFFFQFDPSMLCWLKFFVDGLFRSTSYVIISTSKNILLLGWWWHFTKVVHFYCLKGIDNERTKIKKKTRRRKEVFLLNNFCVTITSCFWDFVKKHFCPFSL